jgi:hypothetical protein
LADENSAALLPIQVKGPFIFSLNANRKSRIPESNPEKSSNEALPRSWRVFNLRQQTDSHRLTIYSDSACNRNAAVIHKKTP